MVDSTRNKARLIKPEHVSWNRADCVLRFWNNQVMTQLDDVLEEISKWCVDPHPSLSLKGRG
jgi:very-short-patch-repair endonuclease